MMPNASRFKPNASSTGLLEQTNAKPDPAKFAHVQLRAEAPVARITLRRPEHNLLNEAMLLELAGSFELLAAREDVKVIVLDAAGKVFSGGIDIGEYTPERAFQLIEVFHRV